MGSESGAETMCLHGFFPPTKLMSAMTDMRRKPVGKQRIGYGSASYEILCGSNWQCSKTLYIFIYAALQKQCCINGVKS